MFPTFPLLVFGKRRGFESSQLERDPLGLRQAIWNASYSEQKVKRGNLEQNLDFLYLLLKAVGVGAVLTLANSKPTNISRVCCCILDAQWNEPTYVINWWVG